MHATPLLPLCRCCLSKRWNNTTTWCLLWCHHIWGESGKPLLSFWKNLCHHLPHHIIFSNLYGLQASRVLLALWWSSNLWSSTLRIRDSPMPLKSIIFDHGSLCPLSWTFILSIGYPHHLVFMSKSIRPAIYISWVILNTYHWTYIFHPVGNFNEQNMGHSCSSQSDIQFT